MRAALEAAYPVPLYENLVPYLLSRMRATLEATYPVTFGAKGKRPRGVARRAGTQPLSCLVACSRGLPSAGRARVIWRMMTGELRRGLPGMGRAIDSRA